MLSLSTPEYVVRNTVSAISSAIEKIAFLNSSRAIGSLGSGMPACCRGWRRAATSQLADGPFAWRASCSQCSRSLGEMTHAAALGGGDCLGGRDGDGRRGAGPAEDTVQGDRAEQPDTGLDPRRSSV